MERLEELAECVFELVIRFFEWIAYYATNEFVYDALAEDLANIEETVRDPIQKAELRAMVLRRSGWAADYLRTIEKCNMNEQEQCQFSGKHTAGSVLMC